MVSFPPCKINLGLNILRKRADGYHDIETCFYPLPLTDILEVVPSSSFEFSSSGSTVPGDPNDNLCVKTYQLLKKSFDVPPAKIHLHKIIPTGAGLGGGSADAAHMLRLLNEVFALNLNKTQLLNLAAALGSDCSFFIYDSPMFASGRGEVLSEVTLSLRGYHLILLNPAIHVSTADAYDAVTPRLPRQPLVKTLEEGVERWANDLTNDFEQPVFLRYPQIKLLKDELYNLGAVYASMSGSGSSVFGIFESRPLIGIKSQIHSAIIWQGELSQ